MASQKLKIFEKVTKLKDVKEPSNFIKRKKRLEKDSRACCFFNVYSLKPKQFGFNVGIYAKTSKILSSRNSVLIVSILYSFIFERKKINFFRAAKATELKSGKNDKQQAKTKSKNSSTNKKQKAKSEM